MKKIAILLALLLVQAPMTVSAATNNVNYNNKPVQQKVNYTKQQPAKQTVRPYSQKNDNDYLLKYNIDDLEVAPWLNGGKRKI